MRYSSEKSERPQKEKPLVALIYPEIDEECDKALRDGNLFMIKSDNFIVSRSMILISRGVNVSQ